MTAAPSYTASYDAAGDMTTRNGQPLTYDTLRRLLTWQNATSNPTSTASYAYDGEGERVWQQTVSNGATTTTQYIGSYEEISTTGSATTTTKYYSAGLTNVTNVNGTLSYLVSDGLGSVSEALSSSGSVTSAQLFAPYGATRYSSGTMPTSYGYTGQRGDPSGLTYMHARYYDGSVGAFTSADTVQGLNRYGYVAGNPTTMTDPTGQSIGGCNGAYEDEDGIGCVKTWGWLKYLKTHGHPPPQPPAPVYHGCVGCTGPVYDFRDKNNKDKEATDSGCKYSTDSKACWYIAANDYRNSTLNSTLVVGAVTPILLGLFIEGAYALAEAISGGGFKAITSASQFVLDFILEATSYLIYLVPISWKTMIYNAIAIFTLLESVLHIAINFYNSIGWFKRAADAVLSAAMSVASGPVGIVLSIIKGLAGDAVSNIIDASSEALFAAGNYDFALYSQQLDMPISTWCQIYQGCPAGPA